MDDVDIAGGIVRHDLHGVGSRHRQDLICQGDTGTAVQAGESDNRPPQGHNFERHLKASSAICLKDSHIGE
jgi:hypothetical protein